MPLIAHNNLPTFNRLRQGGNTVLPIDRAEHQDIRELHIGLLNMMPDAALEATERQFFRLVGASNQIAQFFIHPFSLDTLPRGEQAQQHIARHYDTFENIQQQGLDALIISGANVTHPDLAEEVFWEPLAEIVDWAMHNVTSTICSCLATHAVMQHRFGQKRQGLKNKCWGVFNHRVRALDHPLVSNINTRFDVPHSRFNEISPEQFRAGGIRVLVDSDTAGVQVAVTADGFRMIFFQGHPEYDTISLMKEYKREVSRFVSTERSSYPPFPANTFNEQTCAIFSEYEMRIRQAMDAKQALPEFPEHLVNPQLENTWHDTGKAIVGNWIGLVYQVTSLNRRLPFMDGVDPNDPLSLK